MSTLVTGVIVAVLTIMLLEEASERLFINSTGTTYPELSRMKEECEHSLPRNQHCVASIIFIPTASKE